MKQIMGYLYDGILLTQQELTKSDICNTWMNLKNKSDTKDYILSYSIYMKCPEKTNL